MSDRKTVNTKISKFLSLVLRHNPESIGLILDAEGWADINAVIVGVTPQSELDFQAA